MGKDCNVETYEGRAQIFDIAEYVIEFEQDEPWDTSEYGWSKTPNTDGYAEWHTVLYEEVGYLGAALFNARLREWPDGRVELLITPHPEIEMDFTVDGKPANGFIVSTDKEWSSLRFSVPRE